MCPAGVEDTAEAEEALGVGLGAGGTSWGRGMPLGLRGGAGGCCWGDEEDGGSRKRGDCEWQKAKRESGWKNENLERDYDAALLFTRKSNLTRLRTKVLL